ncbi:LysR family transcriptional regulator [Edaphobacter bradus]|uniref:LysR family transcriptional regulator n=1 Tax=Edaphobacter bradus TaxID=2259016 RepID=UPI0021E0C38E|nr:LysR family transcriptional regulator [Edaphobacter bradus]
MELRHFRYFTSVVQWNGYREAARQRHVAQPALSQAVAELEEELGLKLFLREKRRARLTPEGEVFYKEAVRVLQQVEEAVESARRAARGEIGVLRIGFLGSATASFLPGLIRLYRERYPGVKLVLDELTPVQQDDAFARGELDLGFTRPLSNEQAALLDSRTIYREPLLVAMPERMAPRKQTVDLKTLEQVPLVLFHRRGAPGLFDSITALCREAGFIPRVEHEPNLMQTVLSLVASEAGATIVPACVRNLRADGVAFRRITPDHIRIELVAAWSQNSQSVVLQSFLDLVQSEAANIRAKTAAHMPRTRKH